MIKITVPTNTIEDGQMFRALAEEAAVLNIDRRTVDDGANMLYETKTPNSLFYARITPMVVAGVVSAGGSVEGYPVYVRMTASYASTTDVPSYVPGATYVNDEEVTVTRKWNELVPVGSFTVEGVDYTTKEGTDGITYWDGSVIAQLVGAGMDVLTRPEFQAWVPTEE
tara:strand:- start:35 stop:538 length:504 start_codon:yes stop_codon:yes gene_type:complete